MKSLGLIGGTTWLSMIDYYRIINQEVNHQLGDLHSAKLLIKHEDCTVPVFDTTLIHAKAAARFALT
jgi:aspartate/glutamate racemase